MRYQEGQDYRAPTISFPGSPQAQSGRLRECLAEVTVTEPKPAIDWHTSRATTGAVEELIV